MAALDSAATELASSLTLEEIPTKLRCATCNKLAVDAVKLPCCDQSICQPCSLDLPEQCPVCEHSPLAAEECKPNKSLRMTIKAFLKSEEKKRGKDVSSFVVQSIEATASLLPPSETPAPHFGTTEVSADPQTDAAHGAPSRQSEKTATPAAEQAEIDPGQAHSFADISRDSQPVVADATDQETAALANQDDEEDEDDEDNIVVTTERPEQDFQQDTPVTDVQEQFAQNGGGTQQAQGQMNGGFDHSQQGFPNMNFGGMNGFNPMMAMQNGMGMPGFPMGMPNMMGMGMNMDPSVMFNGGFGGGMGGMNDMGMMGMGMGGFGGFGGMPGMGMNGPGGHGGFHGQGGYNTHQNFGNHMNQSFRYDRGFGRPYGRGYGRGRGFNNLNHGRGGFGFQNQNVGQQQNFNQNQGSMINRQHQLQSSGENGEGTEEVAPPGARGSPTYEPMKNTKGTADGEGSDHANANDTELENAKPSPTNNAGANGVDRTIGDADTTLPIREAATNENTEVEDVDYGDAEVGGDIGNGTGNGSATGTYVGDDNVIQTVDGIDPVSSAQSQNGPNGLFYVNPQFQQPYGFGAHARGAFRGRPGFRGRGGMFGGLGGASEATDLTPAPAPPANAPTGPKAMREGKPNTGWYSRAQPPSQPPVIAPQPEENTSKQSKVDDHGRSQSRSRSRSKHRSHRHKQRSTSRGSESDATYERRKEREKRRRRDTERRDDEMNGEEAASRKGRSGEEPRDEMSSSRYRRDKEEDRTSRSRRDRSRDRRRRRHRSRSPDRDSSLHRDGDDRSHRKSQKDRKYDDEYERDRNYSRRDHDHDSKDHPSRRDRSRDRRHTSERGKPSTEVPSDELGFKIKGSKSADVDSAAMAPPPAPKRNRRRGSDARARTTAAVETPAAPPASTDPYAEERERRHAERVAKEQQRRQSTHQPQSLGKRMTRDEPDEPDALAAPTGPKVDQGRAGKRSRRERRMNVKYEGEVGEGGFEEREAGRWR